MKKIYLLTSKDGKQKYPLWSIHSRVNQIKAKIREKLAKENRFENITWKFDCDILQEEKYCLEESDDDETNSLDNTEDDYNQMVEWLTHEIDEYIQENILEFRQYNHDKVFEKKLITHLFLEKNNNEWECFLNREEFEHLVSAEIVRYMDFMSIPKRTSPRDTEGNFLSRDFLKKKEKIEKTLKYLENVEQPDQRTGEWYLFRHNLLTASSIWKALDTQSQQNNLILGKCEPIDPNKYSRVNLESAFEWGHRYEPLSTMIYEHMYNTKVGEFGCIKDQTISFLGASPDGINIDPKNPLYGRMLEIKNPKSRIITGTPKKDYWVQMQMQMHCCMLGECDFFETKFVEYENKQEFMMDYAPTTSEGKQNPWYLNKDEKRRGIIKMFQKANDQGVIYVYSPLNLKNMEEYEEWNDRIMDKNENLTWMRDIYWYLNNWSCVLVKYNGLWVKKAIPKFAEIWKTILHERENGYEHRRPKKRAKKVKISPYLTSQPTTKLEAIERGIPELNLPCSRGEGTDKKITIKIRTESFEEFKKKKSMA